MQLFPECSSLPAARNTPSFCLQAQAVLRGVPQSVLKLQGPAAVRKELLVGFDPLLEFVARLQLRLGHLATFCTDYVGGRIVAVKWDPERFLQVRHGQTRAA